MNSQHNPAATSRRRALQLFGGFAAASPAIPRSLSAMVGALAPETEAATPAFQAVAYNHISYNTRDYAASRDFYAKLLGMKVVYDNGKQCSLEFGSPVNALYIRNLKTPDDKARVDHFCFSIPNFDSQAVLAKLRSRNIEPKPDGHYSWAFPDPNAFNIHVTAEHGVYPGQNAPNAPADYTGPIPPQPVGADKAPFKAVAVSCLTVRTADVAVSRDFYLSLFGMRKVYEDSLQCFLAFGPSDNHLCLRKLDPGDTKPYVESFKFTTPNFIQHEVESELVSLSVVPEPDTRLAVTMLDPDGFRFGIAQRGLPEYIGTTCHGDAAKCPTTNPHAEPSTGPRTTNSSNSK